MKCLNNIKENRPEEKISVSLKRGEMKKKFLILIMAFTLISAFGFIYASDVLVWQGQYYTGTTFNTGTYDFNFTVYDALTGGYICYSNTTTLTTGNFGEWKTEQSGVSSVCNNVSQDYFLNINIDGTDQTPRRRLVVWNSLRKDVDEITVGKLQTASQIVAPIVQANTQVIAPIVNTTQIATNEITVRSNANILGILRGHSPLKIGDSIQFVDINDTNLFSVYTAGQNITGNNVSSQYYGVVIHQIESHTNPSEIEECWWDREDQEMRMCMDKTNIEIWNNLIVNKNINVTGNITASHFIGDGSLLTGINSSSGSTNLTDYALKNQSEIFAGNITTTQTGFFGWLGSLTSRITKLFVQDIDASGNVNASNYTLNETTIQDWNDISNGLTNFYLESDLTATNADYTTIFTIALTPSKMNIVKIYLIQSSPTNGVAVQNRVIVSEAGPVGNCNFMTQAGDTVENVDNIAVSTTSADTGETAMSLDVDVPFINTIICTILADASQKDLIVQFESERNTANITTYTGSYYTNAVNE